MSELIKPPNGGRNVSSRQAYAGEDETVFLRQRVAELEDQNQQLYQQSFLLQQRLSASNVTEKERAEFISHVAHELRTPLTSIKGYVDLVLEGETGPINEMQREFLGVVGINAEKLSRIIGDLLDVSRLEAGQIGFKPTVTDLQDLVLQTSIQVRPQLQARGVEFEVEYNPAARMPASLDPERMSQALRALIAHAGQVTPVGGLVRLRLSTEDSTAVIRVEDQGAGIESHDMERVFTKFWQPQNQVWREGSGPGLGLAIAKSIIDLHEGQVEAANRMAPAVGSVITVHLPLIQLPVSELGSLQMAVGPESGPQYAALVITRNPDFGRVIEQSLGQEGFQVIVASDRSELVAETPAWQPDLIINNGAEPDLLNEEDTKTLAPALRGAAILTLNLSATEQRVIANGAQAVLPWPATDSVVLDNLEQVISLKKPDELSLEEYKQLQSILLVSQSSENLRGLDRLLQTGGYSRIFRATREADALTLARRYAPNWLLLDVQEDELGTEAEPGLFEMLREDQFLTKTPTVVFLRPDQIAPAPSPDYQPELVRLVNGTLQKGGTGELRGRRGGTGELRGRGVTGELRTRGGTGELRGRAGTGELRSRGGTGELNGRVALVGAEDAKGLYYNVVPKPFLQRRLVTLARRLVAQRYGN